MLKLGARPHTHKKNGLMPLRTTLCMLGVLLLAGCSQADLVEKFASEDDKKRVTECIDQLRSGDIASIEKQIDPSLRSPQLHDTLVQLAEAMPDDEPDSVKLVGVQTNVNNGVRTANLTYEFNFGGNWLWANCAFKKDGEMLTIIGVSVQPQPGPWEEQSQFRLEDKPASSYAVLVAACLAVLVSVTALILCIMHRGLRHKWAWIIFILLGIGTLTLDWNSGEMTYAMLHFQLLSAGVTGAPWVVSVALPLGALVYLARRFLNHRRPARSNPD